MMFVWRQEGRLSELFCVVLCAEAVHSHKHT